MTTSASGAAGVNLREADRVSTIFEPAAPASRAISRRKDISIDDIDIAP
jgi:hypothetical protein